MEFMSEILVEVILIASDAFIKMIIWMNKVPFEVSLTHHDVEEVHLVMR